MNPLDVAVAKVAARQRSLVHRDQTRALGMTLRQFQGRTNAGLYVRSQPNVVRMADAPVTWEQRVLAACMSAGDGAAASHRSAALLLGLRGVEQAPVEITVPGSRRPTLYDAVLHRSPATECTPRRGIPVTSPATTLLVLGAVVDDATLESAVEERGGGAATESILEDMMVRLLRRAGWPTPERQFRVSDVRLDLAYPARKLGIEVHGVAFHSATADVQRNAAKLNRLLALGWRILQFTWADIRYRPGSVLDQLAMAA